jgi:chromosomal replication initiator protein
MKTDIATTNYMALPGLKPGCEIYSNKTPEHIIEVVCKHLGLSVDDIRRERRFRHLVEARQIAMFLIKKHTPRSLNAIAFIFGGKDHTTVIHSIQTVESLCFSDHVYKQRLLKIENDL